MFIPDKISIGMPVIVSVTDEYGSILIPVLSGNERKSIEIFT